MPIVIVPAGSPSHGGDVKICVLGINQPSLPTPFPLFLYLFLSLMALSPVFQSINSPVNSPYSSRSGELRTQKLKFHLVRTQSSNVLLLKRGVGQYIAIHAALSARDFFLADFYPSGPFTCIFSKTSPDFFPVLAVANTGSCVGPQNKIGHPAGCRFPY